jgi:hypothetical protein
MHGKYMAKAANHAGLPVSLDHSLPVHHVVCRNSEGSSLQLTLERDLLADLDAAPTSRGSDSVHGAVHSLFPVGSMVMGNVAHGLHDCSETFYTRVERVSIVPHPTNSSRLTVYLDGERTEWMDLYEYADIELRNFHNASAATEHATKRGLIFPASFPGEEPSSTSVRVSWNYNEETEGPLESKDLISVESMNVYLTCDECYFFLEVDFVFHTILEFYWFPFPHIEPTLLLLEVDQRSRMELNTSLEFQTAMTLSLWEYSPDCLKMTVPPSFPLTCSSAAPGDPECPGAPMCLPNPGIPFGPLFILFTLKPQIDLELKAYFWLKFYNLGVQSKTDQRFAFRWSRSDSPALPQISYENREADGGGMRVLIPGLSLQQRTPPLVRVRIGFGPQLKMTWWGKAFPVSFRFTPMLGVTTQGATCDDGQEGVRIEPVWGVAQALRIGILEDLKIFGKKVSFRIEGAIPVGHTAQLIDVHPLGDLATCLSLGSSGGTSPLAELTSGAPQGSVESPSVVTDGPVDMMGQTDQQVDSLCTGLSSCGACLTQRGCAWCPDTQVCQSVGGGDEATCAADARPIVVSRDCAAADEDDSTAYDANIDFVLPAPSHLAGPIQAEELLLVPGATLTLSWILAKRLVQEAAGRPTFFFAMRSVSFDEAIGSGEESGLVTVEELELLRPWETQAVWFCGFGLPCEVSLTPDTDSDRSIIASDMDVFTTSWTVDEDMPVGTYQLVVYNTIEVAAVSAYVFVEEGLASLGSAPVAALTTECSAECGEAGFAYTQSACVSRSLATTGTPLSIDTTATCASPTRGPWTAQIPCNRVACVETQLELVRPTRADLATAGLGSPLIIEWTGGRTDGFYHVEFLMPDCSTWVQVGYTQNSHFHWFYPFGEYFEEVKKVGLPTWELSTRFRVTLHSNPTNYAVSPFPLPMFQVAPQLDAGRQLRMQVYTQAEAPALGFTEAVKVSFNTLGSWVELWGRGTSLFPLKVQVEPESIIVDTFGTLSTGPGRSVGVSAAGHTAGEWTYVVLSDVQSAIPPYRDVELTESADLIVIQHPYVVVEDMRARPMSIFEEAYLSTLRNDMVGLVCWRRWDLRLREDEPPLGGKAGVHFCAVPLGTTLRSEGGLFGEELDLATAPCVDDYQRGSLPFLNLDNTREKVSAYRSIADDAEDRTGMSLGVLIAVSLIVLCLCGLALLAVGAALGIRWHKKRSGTGRVAARLMVSNGGSVDDSARMSEYAASVKSSSMSRTSSRGTLRHHRPSSRRNSVAHSMNSGTLRV